jgi:hypothetical protein
MSVTGTPLDNKHLRMSMAGSHSTRATRKEYDSTKSLYGIPEESGWSIPMPAIQAERARKNVMAVYYTCLDTDGTEITSTPDVAFADEHHNGSYFDPRATAMSDSIRADGSMSELVQKLDSLDDFFDDRQTTTSNREMSRGSSIEDRENIYEQQTLPILHKSLKRNASVTSFQNGFSDTRFGLAREPLVMTPGAFASNPAIVASRPGLHARSVTSPMAAIHHMPRVITDLQSEEDTADEPFSDDDLSISRMTTSDDALSVHSSNSRVAAPSAAGLRAGFRSGMRRLTGGTMERSRDMKGGLVRLSPQVPRVPTVWLSNPKSSEL